jgi:hypothetical protein
MSLLRISTVRARLNDVTAKIKELASLGSGGSSVLQMHVLQGRKDLYEELLNDLEESQEDFFKSHNGVLVSKPTVIEIPAELLEFTVTMPDESTKTFTSWLEAELRLQHEDAELTAVKVLNLYDIERAKRELHFKMSNEQ